MKNFPAAFAAQKNLKQGAKPFWILKLSVSGVTYYLSDNTYPVTPWGITTRAWIKSWGTVLEGVSGALDEFKISDFSVTAIADPDASPHIVDLVLEHDIEKELCSLYLWFVGCTDPPQEFFRGYVKDCPLSEGDTICTLRLQDETLKWEGSYVGEKVTLQKYPHADPDDVGKIMPLVFGSVAKLPTLAVDAGVQTSLAATIGATATSVTVSDASGLAVGMLVQVDAEQMEITAKAGSVLTVVRGANGTLADAHQKAAICWEWKAAFFYIVSGKPVAQIPKAYCAVGQSALDISAICTAWPAGNHPSYPGVAVIEVPGYITVEQAISLAIAENITVSNGTLTSALSGNVTRSGSVTRTGTVTLAGLIALIGSIIDPGHTHNTGSSVSENTTTTMPTGVPAATSGYASNGTWGITGFPNVYYIYLDFPADGARSSVTYNITFVPLLTVNSASLYAVVDGVRVASYVNNLNFVSGTPFQFSFTIGGDVRVDRVYIATGFLDTTHMKITAASRTIMLTSFVSSAANANLNNSLDVTNGTLGVSSTLDILDTLGIDRGTLAAALAGTVSKAGTVALSGNSVANTLVGDELLVDVVGALTDPADCIFDILADWTPVASCQKVGAFPVGYAFNGAITEYRLALDVVHDLAWQCRSWFRHSLGKAVLTVRTLNPTVVKTLDACRVEGGKKDHSRDKSPYGEIINVVKLLYKRDWTKAPGDSAYMGLSEDSNNASIGIYGVQERPELFMCDMITAEAMADDVRAFYLAYYSVRHWIHTFGSYYYDAELEFADGVELAFAQDAIGQVESAGFNPGSDNIQLKVVQ